MKLSEMTIVEAGHVTEVYGPVQALRNYLIKKAGRFIFITHPFSYTKLAGTEVIHYVSGKEVKREKGHKLSKNQAFQWTRDYAFNLNYLKKNKIKADFFMGVDNLNALTGIKLKKAGLTKQCGYYIIDHMDRRFSNPVFNSAYEYADSESCKKSDYVWSLSKRIKDVKDEKFGLNENNIVVPVGIELDKVDIFSEAEKVSKKTMVLMSMLDETKGVQLLIQAMQDIKIAVPEAELLIIGTGPYEEELKKLTAKLELKKNVKFLGLMDHDRLFKYIPHQRIGMAPYMDDPNNYTYYADPTKPKEYLGCGLPLVITTVPWIAEYVQKLPMGIACRYNKEEIVNASVKLLKDNTFYLKCLRNAVKFASRLSWDEIYDEAFKKMGIET